MKGLAWYTIIFNAVIIVCLVLTGAGVIPKAPFSWAEDILWIILTLPVVWLGIRVVKGGGTDK